MAAMGGVAAVGVGALAFGALNHEGATEVHHWGRSCGGALLIFGIEEHGVFKATCLHAHGAFIGTSGLPNAVGQSDQGLVAYFAGGGCAAVNVVPLPIQGAHYYSYAVPVDGFDYSAQVFFVVN